MNATTYENYGPPEVVQIKEVPKPVPQENEVLIKVKATTVTAVDSIFRKGEDFFAKAATGFKKPKNQILGTEFSGIIESIGSNVKSFNNGDEVFGEAGSGAHSEYICLPENSPLILKPANLTFEEAATLPYGFLTALPFLRDGGKISAGDKLLINGASSSVGTAAVQIGKYFGAEVTAVCSSSNEELVSSLGADKVIDYKKEDFTIGKEYYDITFDAVGKSSFSESKKVLKKKGVYLTTVVSLKILYQMLRTSIFWSKKAKILFTGMRKPEQKNSDLELLKKLVEEGRYKPVIDKSYHFENINEAHAYVDSGRKKGNVIVVLD